MLNNNACWIAAIIPILILLIGLIFLKFSASTTSLIGLTFTVISAIFIFKAPLSTVIIEAGKGLWNALPILAVIMTAVSLYEVTSEAKTITVFRQLLCKISNNELLQILIVGCVFVSYLQGITGFGVPIVVGAPLLVGLNVKPVYAVIISTIGYCWANTYGTLAAAWDALVQSSDIVINSQQFFQLSFWSCIFLIVVNLICCLFICWLYGGSKAIRKGFVAVMMIVISQSVLELVCGQFNTTIAAFLPSTISLLLVIWIGKMKIYRDHWKIENSKIMNRNVSDTIEEVDVSAMDALFPYIVLTVITFACLLVKPINNLLSIYKIGISFPKTVTGYGYINEEVNFYSPISIFTHPSVFLLMSSLIGYYYYRKRGYISDGRYKEMIKRIIKKIIPSVITVSCLLIMSKIMFGTGQTTVLAYKTAELIGERYSFLASFIGAVGSFITGSNMSSNILFANFQQSTARMLCIDENIILACQTSGAAVGGIASPGNISLGMASVASSGNEGEVLKKNVPIALVVSLLISIISNMFI